MKNEIIHSNIKNVHGLEAHLTVRTSPTNKKTQINTKKLKKIKKHIRILFYIFPTRGGVVVTGCTTQVILL